METPIKTFHWMSIYVPDVDKKMPYDWLDEFSVDFEKYITCKSEVRSAAWSQGLDDGFVISIAIEVIRTEIKANFKLEAIKERFANILGIKKDEVIIEVTKNDCRIADHIFSVRDLIKEEKESYKKAVAKMQEKKTKK